MGIRVKALARASPDRFIGGADVEDALLDHIDQPENMRESVDDLLKGFAVLFQGVLGTDAGDDFFVKDVDCFPKEFRFIVKHRLHDAMEAEEFFFDATALVDVGGDHQGHGAGDGDKTAEKERSVVIGGEGTKTSNGTPSG